MWIYYWLTDRDNRHKPWAECPGRRAGQQLFADLTGEGLLLAGFIPRGRRVRRTDQPVRIIDRLRKGASPERRRARTGCRG